MCAVICLPDLEFKSLTFVADCCFRLVLGRAHVRTVAETRKAELEQFLKYLLRLSPELAQVRQSYWPIHSYLSLLPVVLLRLVEMCVGTSH